MVTIRSAHIVDARSMANLHVAAWRHTYHALAPAEAYAALDEEHRFAGWRTRLATPGPDQVVLLAERKHQIVGIGAAGAPSHQAFGDRAEIKSLYVDPACKRQGIGRLLLAALATHLADRHYRAGALGVVAGNEPAIAFYEALGARAIGAYTDPGPLWCSHNLVYVWDDLTALINAPAALPRPSAP